VSRGLNVQVFEAGSDVGGTWYWNRYPGARVDIESMAYSFSFSDELQQEWEWSEKYSPQPELLKYAQHIADRFDLKSDIAFDTRVASAHFDEDTNEWLVTTECGRRVRAQHLVMATGVLSASKTPDITGRDNYRGETYRTGLWPKDGCRLYRETGRGYWHWLVGRSGDSINCRGSRRRRCLSAHGDLHDTCAQSCTQQR
jgi:cyclohexanone monooxygenase